MKKIITILALMIINIIAKSQITIAPGFIANSTSTYTNTGFDAGIYNSYTLVKNMDSLNYITFNYGGMILSNDRFDTLKLNNTYDTIKVHMDVLTTYGNTTTLTINGISTIFTNIIYSTTQKTYQYDQIITNSNQLNYIVSSFDASTGILVRTTLKNYTVKLIKNNATVGIEEATNKVNNLSVFPNPATSNFKIKFNAITEKALVKIYDTQGNVVLENNDERNVGQNILDINTNLTSGIYSIVVTDSFGKTTLAKFVKE